uniref:Uncharacterized protein n=1 Tax=Medicago truncatula TaxID=3880 RepID=I3SYE2_MEDTR|nr:unknown [Medicago truncatula]
MPLFFRHIYLVKTLYYALEVEKQSFSQFGLVKLMSLVIVDLIFVHKISYFGECMNWSRLWRRPFVVS